MVKIAAGIVLYNPDNIERLNHCIQSILPQVSKVYIYDNSSQKYDYSFTENVIYKSRGKNLGIAFALNELMQMAEADEVEWLITLDQDSIVPDNLVQHYLTTLYEEKDNNIAIICPQVIDKRRKYMHVQTSKKMEYVDECITSASCTSVEAWKKVGGFDNWLFIDLVDNEFCKRLVVSDYKILRLNFLVLDQEFGNIEPKSELEQKFWIFLSKVFRNQNIAKLSYKKNVSPMRVYYTCRNIIYVNKKLRNYEKTAYSNYHCKGYFGFIIAFILPSFLRAKNKWLVLKEIIRGTKDGLNSAIIEWHPSKMDK